MTVLSPWRFARFDIVAGVVVAIVALPLALGFGVTSGAGAASGLVTAIVAGLLAGLLGGSNYQVSGPTGAMVVVLFPIIAEVGMPGLVVVGALAGVLVVLAGVARLGKFAEKIPWSVMEGFTLGIAIVIALQQLPLILDVPRGEGTETLRVAWGTILNAGLVGLNLWPIALVVATIAVKVGWTYVRRILPVLDSIPASGVAVVTLTFFVWLADPPVVTIGGLPAGEIFQFALEWPNLEFGTILYAAAIIAVLGAVESLLSARVADAMVKRRDGAVPHPYSADRELIGQGIATTVASLVGGMPATGAIARTAVNVNAGAKTRLSAVVHALVLVIFVFALGPVVALIPTAVLAGVLLGASWRIANPSSILENLRTTWPERIAYLTTAVGVVAIDLIWGTVIGIVIHTVATHITRRGDLQ